MDTRVVLIHCGEPSVAAVRAALEGAEGYNEWWDVVEVENVSPMDAAFNEMLAQATRRWHVQVDADMVLRPHAIRLLRELIVPLDRVWQFYCPLWDTLFNRPIAGVKIYRSEVARVYPYRAVRHCETDQYQRAEADGWALQGVQAVVPRSDTRLLGDHVVLDPRTAFWSCLDRGMRQRWLVRQGRPDWFQWLTPYYQLFPKWWRETGDVRYLAGFAGLCAALSAEIPDEWGEKDASAPPPAWDLFWSRFSTTPEQWASSLRIPLWLLETWL